jgi:hypothetical protein
MDVMVVLGLEGDAGEKLLSYPKIMSSAARHIVHMRLQVIMEPGAEPVTFDTATFQITDMVRRPTRWWKSAVAAGDAPGGALADPGDTDGTGAVGVTGAGSGDGDGAGDGVTIARGGGGRYVLVAGGAVYGRVTGGAGAVAGAALGTYARTCERARAGAGAVVAKAGSGLGGASRASASCRRDASIIARTIAVTSGTENIAASAPGWRRYSANASRIRARNTPSSPGPCTISTSP